MKRIICLLLCTMMALGGPLGLTAYALPWVVDDDMETAGTLDGWEYTDGPIEPSLVTEEERYPGVENQVLKLQGTASGNQTFTMTKTFPNQPLKGGGGAKYAFSAKVKVDSASHVFNLFTKLVNSAGQTANVPLLRFNGQTISVGYTTEIEPIPYQAGQWYDIVLVLDCLSYADRTISVYVNGVEYSGACTFGFGDFSGFSLELYSYWSDAPVYVDDVRVQPLSDLELDTFRIGGTQTGVTTEIPDDTNRLDLTFNNPIDPATLSSLALTSSDGDRVSINAQLTEYDQCGVTAFIDPSTPFKTATTYTLSYSGVADRYGTSATGSVTFTTAGTAALPVLSASIPQDGAADVDTYTAVTLTFSRAMDPQTLVKESFSIAGGTLPVDISSVQPSADGLSCTITFASRLEGDTAYTLTLGDGIADASGAPLDGKKTIAFTTATIPTLPVLTGSSPQNGASGVSLYTGVTLTFSKPIDPATLTPEHLTLSGGAAPIGIASVQASANRLNYTVTFDRQLEGNTTYTLTLSDHIADTEGNALDGTKTVVFTTAGEVVIEVDRLYFLANGMETNQLQYGDITAVANVRNRTDAPQPLTLILGLYETAGDQQTLKAVQSKQVQVPPGESQYRQVISIDESCSLQTHAVKVFLWDDLQNVRPYALPGQLRQLQPPDFADDLDDFTKAYDHSPTLILDKLDSDTRIVNMGNSPEGAFITYHFPAGIENVRVFGYSGTNVVQPAISQLGFYVADSGMNFQKLQPREYYNRSLQERTIVPYVYEITQVPTGMEYLKIVYEKRVDARYVWSPSIGRVELNFDEADSFAHKYGAGRSEDLTWLSQQDRDSLHGTAIFFQGADSVLKHGTDRFLGRAYRTEDGRITVRSLIDALDAQVAFGPDGASVTIGGTQGLLPGVAGETDAVSVRLVADTFGLKLFESDGLIVLGGTREFDELADYGLICTLIRTLNYREVSREDAARDFALIRSRWKNVLVGGQHDTGDPLLAQRIRTISNNANYLWGQLKQNRSDKGLWKDMTNATDYDVHKAFHDLGTMALGYATYGSALYQNAELRDDILDAVQWLCDNKYNRDLPFTGNWYYWEIDTPTDFLNILLLLYEDIPRDKMAEYLSILDYFLPNATTRAVSWAYPETGGNRMGKVNLLMVRAALDDNVEKMQEARDAMSQVFEYVTTGDGFYRDGSFIQHDRHPYNGSYGTWMLDCTAKILYLTDGTAFELTDPLVNNVNHWVDEGYTPLMYRSAIMDMVRGRSVTRAYSGLYTGREVLQSMLLLSLSAEPQYADKWRSYVKTAIGDDGDAFLETCPLYLIAEAQRVLSDDSIALTPFQPFHKVYGNMDRVVHQRDDFAAGISMSSSRIFNYESISNENMKGWYSGDGMLYVYTDWPEHFNADYFNNVNPYRLPGTTVDTYERAEISVPYTQEYLSSKDWVGGSQLNGLYGSAGMWLDAYESTLEAKKSWFLFDDEIVALGAGITGGSTDVVTTVENRRLKTGTEALYADGVLLPDALNQTVPLANPKYMYLEGFGGYYFPAGGNVSAVKEGSSSKFYSIWFDHGTAPDHATYEYVLLPGMSQQETAAYSAAPDAEVLANSPEVQAVYDHSTNVYGMNFWQAGTCDIITALQECSVTYTLDGGKLDLGISDPTHKLDSLTLDIALQGLTLETPQSGVQVTPNGTTTRLTVTTEHLAGGTVSLSLKTAE